MRQTKKIPDSLRIRDFVYLMRIKYLKQTFDTAFPFLRKQFLLSE
ncbi:hypothetical protein HMPREF0765_4326 [Sphingobacterium spiritivorum ATCC 33300]|uniref:Transposase DDE domain-containing protein n=1 Tax=Sphingobacterium spiritivorum ATCC 33300 TaxID=525372 RepID=C2G420_SPHSI|nr:hypothetical protein HMPREF0765_4326 [Sphingobacterium spiritivorum ATCC 33300]